jgi:hypothetical protein
MKGLIKQLLREGLKEAEFDKGGHSIARIKQRIESIPDEDLPHEVKERVFYNLDKIEATDFSKKKDFAVMVGKFGPDPSSDLYVTDEQGRGYYRINTTEPNAAIKDSTGDEFWMIIRGNVIHTFFLRKSWQTKNLNLNAEKLRVDYSFKSVEAAIDVLGKDKGGEQQQQQKREKPIVNIDGVKWMVNPKDETIFKKNKPQDIYKLDTIMDKLDEPTQEKILSFL